MGSSSRANWVLITDPTGGQREIFHSSLDIYSRLFASQHTEPAENIEKYLIKNLGDCDRDKYFPIRDYYLVGTIDEQVRGMAFLTNFRRWHYSFLSYLGIQPPLNQSSKLLAAKLFAALSGILQHDRIVAVLYEIERILSDGVTDPACEARISALRTFQRVGARAISCLNYFQPNLDEPCEGPVCESQDLRLMVCYTSPIQVSSLLSIKEVSDFLQFVYQELYLSGYQITHADRIEQAKAYLDRLRSRSLASVPIECRKIPLVTVATPLQLKEQPGSQLSVFISHTSDGSRVAEIVHSFLEKDMGLEAIEWNHDHHLKAGEGLKDTMESWVQEENRVIVAVLTPKSVNSHGVLFEIGRARAHHKNIIALVSSELKEPHRSQAIGFLGPKEPVYIQFEPDCLDRMLSDLHERILREMPGARSTDALNERRRRTYFWCQRIWNEELKTTIPVPPRW